MTLPLPLEVFRKFIRFGSMTRPLVLFHSTSQLFFKKVAEKLREASRAANEVSTHLDHKNILKEHIDKNLFSKNTKNHSRPKHKNLFSKHTKNHSRLKHIAHQNVFTIFQRPHSQQNFLDFKMIKVHTANQTTRNGF